MSEDGDGGLSTAQGWFFGIGLGIVVLALMLAAYVIGFNAGEDEAAEQAPPAAAEKEQTPTEAAAEEADPGRELFVANCGSCHALADAGTTGATGPDLDVLGPDSAQVLSAIENGGAGSGAMPAGILEGKQAQQVAAYVSASAGG